MDQEGEQEDQSEQTGSYPLRCSSQFVPLSLSSPLCLSTLTPCCHASPLDPCYQKVENGMEGERARGGWSLGEGLIKKQSMYSCRGQRGRRRGEERGERSDSGGGTKEQRRE